MAQTVRLVILVLCSSIFVPVVIAQYCPPVQLIDPCVCTEEEPLMVPGVKCSNMSDMDALARVIARSGDRRFYGFLLDQPCLMYLPAKLLVSKQFDWLNVRDGRMISLFDQVPSDANVLSSLKLTNLILQRGMRWELLRTLPRLKNVVLDRVEVKSLGKSFVQNMAGERIGALKLYQTRTSHLHDEAFAKMPILRYLTVEKNKIKVIKRSMFATPAHLELIDFSDNDIETLPEDIFSSMPDLEFIKLSNNKISKLSEATFAPFFDHYFSMATIVLFDNPVECDCSMRWYILRHRNDVVRGTCAGPPDKRGRKISDITEQELGYCR